MKHIFLTVLLLLTGCTTTLYAQHEEGVPFNGLITDVTGQPLKGASVYVHKGMTARSDKKGRFGLTNVMPTDTLHIRYRKTNYVIPVDGRRSIRVHLGDQLDYNEDEELVNWGYGYVKRRESLDVSSGISGEALRQSGYTNLMQALQGKVPGLNITRSSQLGAEPSVNIRGLNSLTLPSTPLYIVDGVEVTSLDYLSVYDVEHVEVLKDASIYGSKGANGAILVTTRRR